MGLTKTVTLSFNPNRLFRPAALFSFLSLKSYIVYRISLIGHKSKF